MRVHKNRAIGPEQGSIQTPLFACLLLMPVCLLISRGALSVSTILFVLVALAHTGFLKALQGARSQYFLCGLTLLFFIPFLSGLWSNDLLKWMDVVRLKLPLLFLPLAFAGSWQLAKKQWRILAFVFLGVVATGCIISLAYYLPQAAQVHKEYLRAKTLFTPLENDHVRFSWLVSVAVLCCHLLYSISALVKEKTTLLLTAIFFVVYLHVLSARTGLISFYLHAGLYALWVLKNRFSIKKALLVLLLVAALPLLAYALLPTFKARVQYLVYDFSFVQSGTYVPGSNDGARTLSLKAGAWVLAQNPLGVGAGDVMAEADKWYRKEVPQALPADKFYPSSEWLLYGTFAGWPGVLLFTLVMVLPFFVQGMRHRFFWLCLNSTAAFSFVFDMGLEVQYGIFLYAFVVLWWWKWLGVES